MIRVISSFADGPVNFHSTGPAEDQIQKLISSTECRPRPHNRDFTMGRNDGSKNVASKMNLRLSLTRLFQLTYFVKCRRTLPELNF